MWNMRMILRALVSLLGFSCLTGCSEDPAPDDQTKPLWEAHWSYTAGNELADINLVSSPATWTATLKDETNYNFIPYSLDQGHVPSDGSLDWRSSQALINTAGAFLREYYANARITSVGDKASFLFGVNEPIGTLAEEVGVTLPKGAIPAVHNVPLSLVFKTKIHSINTTDTGWKWRLTQTAVVHELGHARGLNAIVNNQWYDHSNHAGTDQGICVMISPVTDPQANPKFCGYHKKVLRECLSQIQFDYNPNSPCASFP